MKKKNIALVILCAIILLPILVLAVDFGSVDISLNFIKYHSFEADGLSFDFYGSFGNVHKVKISENGKKICSLEVCADADIFDGEKDAVELCDVNSDGKSDLLILCAIDEDTDVHRKLFLYSSDSYRHISDVDVVNFREDGPTLVCEDRQFRYMAETVEEYTVPYERSCVRTEYEYSEGTVRAERKYVLSYYSETFMYCFGVWEYNSELDELVSVSEDWMDESEYLQKYDSISESFDMVLLK